MSQLRFPPVKGAFHARHIRGKAMQAGEDQVLPRFFLREDRFSNGSGPSRASLQKDFFTLPISAMSAPKRPAKRSFACKTLAVSVNFHEGGYPCGWVEGKGKPTKNLPDNLDRSVLLTHKHVYLCCIASHESSTMTGCKFVVNPSFKVSIFQKPQPWDFVHPK